MSNTANGSKPLIVVLGLGEMGLVHARLLSKQRSIRIGLASKRSDVLETAARDLRADRSFSTYEAALHDPDTSAVVIATAPATHPEMISLAAKAKKHILCEKPLGFDSESIVKALQTVQEAGVIFMVGFMRRWDSAYANARKHVDDGTFGQPIVLKCTSGDPEYPVKYQRNSPRNSIFKDLAVHDIDLARWLTKSEVVRVYTIADALTYQTLKEQNEYDMAACVMEMENGAKIMIHLSRALHYGYNVTSELVCKEGTMKLGDLKSIDVLKLKDQSVSYDIDFDFRERFADAFERQMKGFADLICADRRNGSAKEVMKSNSSYASCWDGLKATYVAEALVRSVNSGVPEKVVYDNVKAE